MSFSYPERQVETWLRHCCEIALAMGGVFARYAGAVDWQVNPVTSAGAETNTNRDLSVAPEDEIDATKLAVDVGALIYGRTPRSETMVRPNVGWNEFNEDGNKRNDGPNHKKQDCNPPQGAENFVL